MDYTVFTGLELRHTEQMLIGALNGAELRNADAGVRAIIQRDLEEVHAEQIVRRMTGSIPRQLPPSTVGGGGA
jgi:hypothetical protein